MCIGKLDKKSKRTTVGWKVFTKTYPNNLVPMFRKVSPRLFREEEWIKLIQRPTPNLSWLL